MEKLARKQVQELTRIYLLAELAARVTFGSTPMNLHLIMSIKRILLA